MTDCGSSCTTPFLLALALVLAACASQEQLTAGATGCKAGDVKIVPSTFSKDGSQTAWCAVCNNKRYVCATSVRRDRVSCQPSQAGDNCD